MAKRKPTAFRLQNYEKKTSQPRSLPVFSMHCQYPCLTIESTDFSSQSVQVVKTAVVTIGRDTVHAIHHVKIPRGQNQQGTTSTGVKALSLGFPKRTDGLLLQMYQRKASFQAFLLHQPFTTRDARSNDDGTSLKNSRFPLSAIIGIVDRFLVMLTSDRMTAMA